MQKQFHFEGKFRREFKRTFCCPGRESSQGLVTRRTTGMSRNPLIGRSLRTTYSNLNVRTTINCNNNNLQHNAEDIPLSAVCTMNASLLQETHHLEKEQ